MPPLPLLRIGGVPEHYNAPFQKVLLENSDEKLFDWISYPGGTGAMLEALEKREIDMAVLLTEGSIKHALSTSNSVRILGTYVDNPLPWGVHVSPTSGINTVEELNDRLVSSSQITRFGVSRFGSGSHLMAIVHATLVGAKMMPKFKVVNNMDGAAKSMEAGEIDVFLWDIPTADKYTRCNVWKVIGQVAGDWPSFVFLVRADEEMDNVLALSEIVGRVAKASKALKSGGLESVQFLCKHFHITENQASQFLESVSWNCKLEINEKVIQTVIKSLRVSGIVELDDTSFSITELVYPSICRIIVD